MRVRLSGRRRLVVVAAVVGLGACVVAPAAMAAEGADGLDARAAAAGASAARSASWFDRFRERIEEATRERLERIDEKNDQYARDLLREFKGCARVYDRVCWNWRSHSKHVRLGAGSGFNYGPVCKVNGWSHPRAPDPIPHAVHAGVANEDSSDIKIRKSRWISVEYNYGGSGAANKLEFTNWARSTKDVWMSWQCLHPGRVLNSAR